MTFDLTVLGSGSALPTSRRYSTAQALTVLERFFLIDCGEGTQLQIRNAKLKFSKLNHIFISHLHGDHVFGLFGLLSTFNLLGRKSDLTIYGHPELESIIKFYKKQFAEELQYKIIIKVIGTRNYQQIYEDKAVEIYSFPLKHRVPCVGYLFKEKIKEPNIKKDKITQYNIGIKDILSIKQGDDYKTSDGKIILNQELIIPPNLPRSYAYCSDTAYYERIIKYIQGVDLLYHEATFSDSDKKVAKQTGHSTASQAALIAKKSGVKKLVIGHFSNRYKDISLLLAEAREIFPETYSAEDLQVFSIE